jgi:hypothetical protein
MINCQASNIEASHLFGSSLYLDVFAEGISTATFKNLKNLQLKQNILDHHSL